MGQITDSSNIDQRNLLCEEQKLFDGNLETGDKNQLSSLWTDFDGLKEVKAMVLANGARGAIIVANIFISSSLIQVASIAAGCNVNVDECNLEIYGFKPSSLITTIFFVSSILTTFTMPVIGSILEYTSLRKTLGVVTASLLWICQSTQFFINESTWLTLAIFQAFSGFLYGIQVLTFSSYLPDIGKTVGTERMTDFAAIFNSVLFVSCMLFLVVVDAIAFTAGFGDVRTTQVSQAINFFILPSLLGFAWKNLPSAPATQSFEPGQNILSTGFLQMWKIAKKVNNDFGDGLLFFFIATIFAEAGMSSFSSISLVYMVEVLGASSLEVSVMFFLVFALIVPGSFIGAWVTKKTDPIISWKLSLVFFSIVTAAAAFFLVGPESIKFGYLFAVLWGTLMGWFYCTEELIFSLSIPKDDESGLTGFFVYCRNILTWLPPLIFTALNEADIGLRWGLFLLVFFFVISLLFLQMISSWTKMLEDAEKRENDTLPITNGTDLLKQSPVVV